MEISFEDIGYSWTYLAQIGTILTLFPPLDNKVLFTHNAPVDFFRAGKTLVPQNGVDAPVSDDTPVHLEDFLNFIPQSGILVGPLKSLLMKEVTAFCHARGQKQSAQRVLVSLGIDHDGLLPVSQSFVTEAEAFF